MKSDEVVDTRGVTTIIPTPRDALARHEQPNGNEVREPLVRTRPNTKREAAAPTGIIVIPKPTRLVVRLRLVGDTMLVTHNFGEKMRRQIRETQQREAGAPKPKHGKRNPKADFEDSIYRDDRGNACIPAGAIREAMASAYIRVSKGFKSDIYTALWIAPDLIPIRGSKPVMREDVVRVGGASRTADLRYRASWARWSCEIDVHYDSTRMNAKSIVYLLQSAGDFIGLCEYRREKGGSWGSFHPESVRERGGRGRR